MAGQNPVTPRLWYQGDVRVFASCLAVALCAACGQPAPAGPATLAEARESSQPATSVAVTPANVVRVRTHLPAGYEVVDLTGRVAPLALWGFGADWAAEPTQCGGLADPLKDVAKQGFSASGPGGIIYVVVADAAARFDPAWLEACGSWSLAAGRTSGTVTLVGAPAVDGAVTVGMATDVVNIVEGGTETHSHADTFVAYLGASVAFVAVVTDPGSAAPPLDAGVASRLLVETVSAVRG